jgi:serine/threonine protein kinase
MGSVHLARDTRLERLVALKVPNLGQDPGGASDPEVLARFFREARAAATLHHPNICPVFDVGEVDGIPFLTMAYLEGRPLCSLVESGEPLEQRRAAGIVRTLALAMQEAHRRGVIHRDLKPSNIMITPAGEPVVMDFGLARRDEPREPRLTRSGVVMGTPAYMAPEQIRGELAAVSHGCDIYALGVILYELLTARVPFNGPVMAVLGQILHEEPEPPSRYREGLDRRLEATCLRAMAKEVDERYATMADLVSALDDCFEGSREGSASRLARPVKAGHGGAAMAPPGEPAVPGGRVHPAGGTRPGPCLPRRRRRPSEGVPG